MTEDQIDLLLPTPAKTRRMPIEPIVRQAELADGLGFACRWTMRRAWGAGPCILWCGRNPSRANDVDDDPTTSREIGFSYRWGFGSMVKVNMRPFVSPTPEVADRLYRRALEDLDECQVWPFPRSARAALEHNYEVVRDQLRGVERAVAAWGNVAAAEVEAFLDNATVSFDTSKHDGFGIVRIPVDWHCLGRNADGSPKHTLARGRARIPDDARLAIWRKADGNT